MTGFMMRILGSDRWFWMESSRSWLNDKDIDRSVVYRWRGRKVGWKKRRQQSGDERVYHHDESLCFCISGLSTLVSCPSNTSPSLSLDCHAISGSQSSFFTDESVLFAHVYGQPSRSSFDSKIAHQKSHHIPANCALITIWDDRRTSVADISHVIVVVQWTSSQPIP